MHGPDYLEIKTAADAMKSYLPDENQRFLVSFASIKATSPKLTKKVVTDSIDEYVKYVENEREVFQEELKTAFNDDFIQKANLIHGCKYNYDLCEYINGKSMVEIKCNIHGSFTQKAESHLRGVGCPKCNPSNKLTLTDFIKRGNEVHHNIYIYIYDKSHYINNKTKIVINCPEHGYFKQTPCDHLNGHGCSICSESSIEKEVNHLLIKNNILFTRQKRFNWLGAQSIDFYIENENIAIECQGIQHFKPVDYFGGIDEYKKIKERDKRKLKLCNENNIKLYYINYFDNIKDKIDLIIK